MTDSETGVHRLILIDDDPTFGFLMSQAAKQRGLMLDYFPSLLAMGYIGRMKDYDGAIIDYKLESMTGVEIGEYLSAFMRDLPMILISAAPRSASKEEPWTQNVRTFVPKEKGHDYILDTILAIIKENKPSPAPAEPSVPEPSRADI